MQQRQEFLVLIECRSVMISGRQNGFVDSDSLSSFDLCCPRRDHDFRRALRTIRRKPCRPGHQGVNAGCITGYRDSLLPIRAFGKHAQIKHRAHPVREIDDDKGVVQNIRIRAAVTGVHIGSARGIDTSCLAVGQQSHQIEKMAAFFNHGATGIFGRAVPVTDLLQEGKTVFPNGDHSGFAGRAVAYLIQQPLHWRHVAVLHGNPYRCAAVFCQSDDFPAVGNGGAKRLFDQQRLVCRHHVPQHIDVSVVWTGYDQGIEGVIGNHLAMAGIGCAARNGEMRRAIAHGVIRIGKCGDPGALQQADIANMFLPHHSCADQAVAQVAAGCVRFQGPEGRADGRLL